MAEAFGRGVRTVVECRRLEGLVTRHQRHWEKLKTDLDSREADKKSLQRQLEETFVKAEADAAVGAERAA